MFNGSGTLSRTLAVLVALFILIPMLLVAVMSFGQGSSLRFPPQSFTLDSYAAYFKSSSWTIPTLNSFVIGAFSAILALAITTPAAFAFTLYDFRGKRLIRLLVMMPLMVPFIVMALAYFFFFGRIGLLNTMAGVIIAHACLSIPIVFLIQSASLKGFDWTLVRASQACGAGAFTTFRRICLPILRPSFLVAGLFAFITSFDETVVALFISGRAASTLPRRMFESVRQESDPIVAVVSTLLFGVVAAVALIVAARQRRAARPANR
ncbi:MAG: ABC transporter permease [Rhodobacteraceae bacterium]|jgi:putative spermidine/putrescine transport system permease protein|nr:ABC transporter permease [Paracoccaceae bacterium]